ncbi:MAG: hypothetical protein H2B00_05680 [Nitrosopumilaceae archaeon]|uniref:Uncharacterized protein n=3 Tax=Candidatus Nitrosomaritimum aestuariumsis TaxID=3342354 RepID=A0AC60VXM5_9ARCH|nr:hypothetical protein [Nitrosopumilaceae archaeon]MBA4459764.1 hypothetical protein [Nitrosopumilaceae archaeon]MBA4461986.1 hypothetical protein [Nitrosopumilaceae archaeon]MBA4462985.1 hypothetical protein [Nitrosopumilaceae archaeon]
MWSPIVVKKPELSKIQLEGLFSGKIPAIILRSFVDDAYCETVTRRIIDSNHDDFQNGKLNHIGPFLMAYSTKKKEYFEKAQFAKKTFDEIFFDLEDPSKKIFRILSGLFPKHSMRIAQEYQNNYSPYVIRIHKNGKSIPVHKDRVSYEGKDYSLSDIAKQLSCILHIQKSEKGGDLIIYKKNWEKSDEKFRNIDFGYGSDLVSSSESSKISNLRVGDLVIINPNNYHEVTTIYGKLSRITLGMFLGFYTKRQEIVAWA